VGYLGRKTPQAKLLPATTSHNAGLHITDFMFQLTLEEKGQLVTNCDRFKNLKHSTSLPHAFTEHGTIMAANALNSPKAITLSVYIVRAFIKLRGLFAANRQLAAKLDELERRLDGHDSTINTLVLAIREITEPILPSTRRRMGISTY
jgi:hypothetical protein